MNSNIEINHPAFNFIHVYPNKDGEYKYPNAYTPLQLMYIEDMKPIENTLMFTQMCDWGRRMTKENEDYTKWNNCVFEDIDYKFYIAANENHIDPYIIYNDVWNWLLTNASNIIYYREMSRSCKGFHFIFYFNVKRTINNRMKAKAISTYFIKEAFKACGYEKELNWPKVYDTCADSFYQPCFITKNELEFNNNCIGECMNYVTEHYYSIMEVFNKLFVKEVKKHKTSNASSNNEWDIEFKFDDNANNDIEYMNHYDRYYLFKSLSGLCGDDEDLLRNEWEKCARMLPEGNKHTTNYYINFPWKGDWARNRTGNEYVDTELLKKFGYDVKFIKLNKDENNAIKKVNKTTKTRIYL